MSDHEHTGCCHCENITFLMRLVDTPDNYHPRSCDCSFCVRHSASYISDPDGGLKLWIRDRRHTSIYRQGGETADFLLCSVCGVLVSVMYYDPEKLYATVNLRALNDPSLFGQPVVSSPRKLNDGEKIKRWRSLWLPDVEINYNQD